MKSSAWKHILLIACASLLGYAAAFTQPPFYIRKKRPPHPTENTWYCNPYEGWRVEIYRNARWDTLHEQSRAAPRTWKNMVMIMDGTHRTVARADGKVLIRDATGFFARDSILGACDYRHDWIVINLLGDTLARYLTTDDAPLRWEKVGQAFGLCVPAYRPGFPNIWDVDIHTWGLLGSHGRWLIAPQYDAPFSFQDGFAEVVYYGQRKKIDEMGAFVESQDRPGQ